MNRQRLILTICVGLFLCSLVYAFLRMPRLKTVEKLKYQPGMSAQAPRVQQKQVPDNARVRLDLLDSKKTRSFAGGKNIFYDILAVEPKKPVLPLPLPPPPPAKPPVEVKPVPPGPTPLQREIATFTFLGFFKNENRKTIFLSNGKEIFLVKKGDKIAGKYEVTSLTDETLTISSVSGGGEILIPLVENKPLISRKK